MILICSFLDSLQTNHIYVVYNIKVIYVISELFNPSCKLESTCDMCAEVWNDIVSDNNLAKEQIWEFSNGMYYHEEYYYNNKYIKYEL